MNTLELKGGIIEMIAGVKNQDILQQLYQAVAEIVTEKSQKNKLPLNNEDISLFNTMIEVEPLENFDMEQLIQEENHLLDPNKVYHLNTPYNTFGAAEHLMAALNESDKKNQ